MIARVSVSAYGGTLTMGEGAFKATPAAIPKFIPLLIIKLDMRHHFLHFGSFAMGADILLAALIWAKMPSLSISLSTIADALTLAISPSASRDRSQFLHARDDRRHLQL